MTLHNGLPTNAVTLPRARTPDSAPDSPPPPPPPPSRRCARAARAAPRRPRRPAPPAPPESPGPPPPQEPRPAGCSPAGQFPGVGHSGCGVASKGVAQEGGQPRGRPLGPAGLGWWEGYAAGVTPMSGRAEGGGEQQAGAHARASPGVCVRDSEPPLFPGCQRDGGCGQGVLAPLPANWDCHKTFKRIKRSGR